MSGHTPEKIAPVQGYKQGIPWSLHLEAYEVYSRKWAPQPALIDLEGRGCRGGFSTGELDEFIPGWRDRASELVRVKAQRDELLAALNLARKEAVDWYDECRGFADGVDEPPAWLVPIDAAIAKAESKA